MKPGSVSACLVDTGLAAMILLDTKCRSYSTCKHTRLYTLNKLCKHSQCLLTACSTFYTQPNSSRLCRGAFRSEDSINGLKTRRFRSHHKPRFVRHF